LTIVVLQIVIGVTDREIVAFRVVIRIRWLVVDVIPGELKAEAKIVPAVD
jgi:hypothetical protein